MPTIADVILGVLKDASVKRIYGIPGDSLNGFTDALRRDGSIAWQHRRHEEAGALAAAAEAALTVELAVCEGSCGPGSINLINGSCDATRSRIPVLAIVAQIPSAAMGVSYFYETHPQDVLREASVYSELISDPEQLPRLLEIAMRTAIERRGAAVVVIPGEIFVKTSKPHRPSAPIRFVPRVMRPTDDGWKAAADLLNAAKRVTIFGGAGVEGAHAELLAIAEKLKAPVVHALRGKPFIEYENPYDIGMTDLLGFTSGYRAIESCDVLLLLGTDFSYRQFYPSKAKIIQVDIRGENLGRRTPIDIGLVGNVKDTVQAILPMARPAASAQKPAHVGPRVERRPRSPRRSPVRVRRWGPGPLGVEQQHQARFHLVKLPFLPAQIQTHLQPLPECRIERRGRWRLAIAPERRDAHRGGMPTETGGLADAGLQQGIFEELADGHRVPALAIPVVALASARSPVRAIG